MKTTLLAAAAILGLAVAAPAFAAEGQGEPFRNNATAAATRVIRPAQLADVGSAQYPNVVGRPGSNLPRLVGEVLPAPGSEDIVQTANSLPHGFEDGTVTYAQAARINDWMVAHNRLSPVPATYAQR